MNFDFIKQLIIKLINEQLAVLYSNKAEIILAKGELEKYELSVDDLIAELESKKKVYSGTPTASRILFYLVGNDNQKEIITMAIQKVTETKKFSFKAVDSFGNEAAVEGAQWALSDPALGALVISEDMKEATFTPAGAVGECKLQLAVDAKIGEGEVMLNGELPLTLIAGDAIAVEIKEVL
jgi:hypothetical protein